MSTILLTEGEPTFRCNRVLSLAQLNETQSMKLVTTWTLMPKLLIDVPSVLPLATVTRLRHKSALSIEFKQMNGISMHELLERHKQAKQPFPEEALCSYILQLLTALDTLEKLRVYADISLDTILVSPTMTQDPCDSSLNTEDNDNDGALLYGECFLTSYNPSDEPCPSPLPSLAGVLDSLCRVRGPTTAQSPPYSRELRAFIRACAQESSTLRPTVRQSLSWFKRAKAVIASAADSSADIPVVLSVVPDRATRSSSPLRSVSPSRLMAHPDYTALLANPSRLRAYLDGQPSQDLLTNLIETAVSRRNTTSITTICDHFAQRQIVVSIKPRSGTIVKKETPLMTEARKGDAVTIKRIMEASPDCLCSAFCGDTALRIASRHGHFAAARLLLGELGIQSPGGWTALMSAARHGHEDIVTLLLPEAGIQLSNGTSALMLAGKYGHVDCVQRLSMAEKKLVNESGESVVDYVEESFRNGTIDAATRRRCLDALVL